MYPLESSHIHGADSDAILLVPPSLATDRARDNPVPFIKAIVDQLNLSALDFKEALAVSQVAPPCMPQPDLAISREDNRHLPLLPCESQE